MTEIYDVLIVGGGIVGLTAAIAMQQRGYTIALIDGGSLKLDATKFNPRVYAINEASRKLFQTVGIWEMMDETAFSPYTNMQVWDAKSGASISFDARLMALNQLGFILEEAQIKSALLQKISTLSNIHLFDQHVINNIQNHNHSVEIYADKNCWKGKLLMITDGAQSSTRELLKVPVTSWPYHQHALVATVKTELPHQQTAWQVFHPEGPLAFLPMKDAHQCSIVWTTSPEEARTFMNATEEVFNRALTQASASRLGKVTLESSRHHFPLIMRHAKKYTDKNWLLLGDAAHTIHPLAGLGLNLGLADLSTWLSVLPTKYPLPVSAKIFGMYQRKRKYETWKVIALMEGLKQLFSTTLEPVVFLRSMGLRACDTLAPLKRFLTEQAMGEKVD